MNEIDLNEILNSVKISTLFKFTLKGYVAMVLAAAPIAILFILFWMIFFGTIIGGLFGLGSTLRPTATQSPAPTPKRISANEPQINTVPNTAPSTKGNQRKSATRFDPETAARLEFEALQQETKQESKAEKPKAPY